MLSNNTNAVADGKTSSKAQAASIIGKTGAQLVMPVSHVQSIKGGKTASATKTAAAEKTVSPKAARVQSRPAPKLQPPRPLRPRMRPDQSPHDCLYLASKLLFQQAQTDFVSTVSHELRTPLTSIKEGLPTRFCAPGIVLMSASREGTRRHYQRPADRLTWLVEDLLAVSRLESKRCNSPTEQLIFQDAVERVQLNLAEKAGET
ncbi:hypothetical protein KF913_09205 [Candidatus Obscuribacterales bacterium]|nr:hypothetical protein [Candidatus Obscuribacterales bacterium]